MKPYKAKSLKGAEREVRKLRKSVQERDALLNNWAQERIALAMLAAETPQFYNPLLAMQAKQLRDRILKTI